MRATRCGEAPCGGAARVTLSLATSGTGWCHREVLAGRRAHHGRATSSKRPRGLSHERTGPPFSRGDGRICPVTQPPVLSRDYLPKRDLPGRPEADKRMKPIRLNRSPAASSQTGRVDQRFEVGALRRYWSVRLIQSVRGGVKMSRSRVSSNASALCGRLGGMQRTSPARTMISFPWM